MVFQVFIGSNFKRLLVKKLKYNLINKMLFVSISSVYWFQGLSLSMLKQIEVIKSSRSSTLNFQSHKNEANGLQSIDNEQTTYYIFTRVS